MYNKIRDDLSNKLIHFTRNVHNESGINNFKKIISEKRIIGGTGYIKGQHKCVCFTETPISKISFIITQENRKGIRYEPFGIMYEKLAIFKQGGRPVIYQTEEEYENLPKEQKYRHVTFNLSEEKSDTIDYTWEREWRIKTESLTLKPEEVTLVVPTRECVEIFKENNERKNHIAGMMGIPQYIEKLEWHFIALEDLGFEIFQKYDCNKLLD